jgi:hypothetical protein
MELTAEEDEAVRRLFGFFEETGFSWVAQKPSLLS